MNLQSEYDVLRQIQQIAASLVSKDTNTRLPLTPSDLNINIVVPPIHLPFPDDVLSPIHSLEIPSSVRQDIMGYLTRCIGKLQQHYTNAYEAAYVATMGASSLDPDLTIVQLTYQARFKNRCIPMVQGIISQVLDMVKERNLKGHHSSGEPKRPFNHEYTPVLDKYFLFNAYPSVAHRSALASKTMMTPRQIEVWFQNHRNRAKKEGKSVPRLASDFPLKQALGVLPTESYRSQNRLPTPSDESTPRDDTSETSGPKIPLPAHAIPVQKSGYKSPMPTFLDDSYGIRPSHAYPNRRSSQFPDPFPRDEGCFKLPSPIWMRKPATVPIEPTAVDMDEFYQTFHLKLNFSENSRRKGDLLPRPEPPFRPWFAATTTSLSSAPHPALVRVPHTPQSKPLTLAPSLDITTFMPAFGSSSLPIFPVPPSISPVSTRKTRPLPRRLPRQPLSKNSYGSRTSSFSSDASSSNDSSSPELSTPPPLPNLDLPVFQDEAQQQDLFDFSHPDHADFHATFSLPDFLPSQDFNFADPYSGSKKYTDIPFFDNIFRDFSHNLGELLS